MEDGRIDDLIAELNRLRICVAQLEARQDVVVIDEEVDVNDNLIVGPVKEGDRIQITNRVRKPATWTGPGVWDEEREKVATVTQQVTRNQIHFVTDNGTRTWRAPKQRGKNCEIAVN